MSAKLVLMLLVGGALLVSGCTSQSPAPAGGAPAATPAPAGGAPAAGAPAGGAAATPAITTTTGSAANFAAAFINCVAGTPWGFTGAAGGAAGGYQVTYTVSGKTQFKGKEFCKVTGTYSIAAGGQTITGNVDIYYRGFNQASPTSPVAYDEMWTVTAAAGQPPQEKQVWAGGKQVG